MIDYKKEYKKAAEWVFSKGYTISESGNNDDMVCFDTKTVFINSRQSPKNMLISILHESGHILSFSNINHFLEKHPIYPYDELDGRVIRSKKYSVCLISEELEAWKKGLGLAKRLKINIDKEEYFNVMTRCVWSYIKSF